MGKAISAEATQSPLVKRLVAQGYRFVRISSTEIKLGPYTFVPIRLLRKPQP